MWPADSEISPEAAVCSVAAVAIRWICCSTCFDDSMIASRLWRALRVSLMPLSTAVRLSGITSSVARVSSWMLRMVPGNLLGSALGALRQPPHFARHHRKSAPVLAGARRLNGRIQGQQIRLLADLLNHVDYLADLLGAMRQRRHLV